MPAFLMAAEVGRGKFYSYSERKEMKLIETTSVQYGPCVYKLIG